MAPADQCIEPGGASALHVCRPRYIMDCIPPAAGPSGIYPLLVPLPGVLRCGTSGAGSLCH
eukprot:1661907-Pyramimonas_sp.AAC.1